MISEEDKVRARGHMGYGGVQESSTFVLGVPAAVQTAFMIEGAWSRILPSHERAFSDLLDKLDEIECQVMGNTGNLATLKVGNIEMNPREFEQLLERYRYWQGKLSNMLQVPPNPFDSRPLLSGAGGGGLNVPVQH